MMDEVKIVAIISFCVILIVAIVSGCVYQDNKHWYETTKICIDNGGTFVPLRNNGFICLNKEIKENK